MERKLGESIEGLRKKKNVVKKMLINICEINSPWSGFSTETIPIFRSLILSAFNTCFMLYDYPALFLAPVGSPLQPMPPALFLNRWVFPRRSEH